MSDTIDISAKEQEREGAKLGEGCGRLGWVDTAMAMAIVMVVLYHVRLLNGRTGENYAFIDEVCRFVENIHMPVFFALSGLLLCRTRIDRGYSVGALYRDKALRLALPLVGCTCLGNLAQAVFNGFVKHPHAVTAQRFMESFAVADGYPWPHRWFLMALIVMMLLYPLYRWLLRSVASEIAALAVLTAVALCPIMVEPNWMAVRQVAQLLPFFFLGMVAYRHGLYRWLERAWLPAVLWAAVALVYAVPALWDAMEEHCVPVYRLLCVCAVVSTAMLADRLRPQLFAPMRRYIFAIYLFGVAFQAGVELIVWRGLGCHDRWVAAFYALNVAAGIFMPIILCQCWQNICFLRRKVPYLRKKE